MSQLGTYNFYNIETLTGDVGGPVYAITGNVNIVGDGIMTVVGDPVTATLTITTPGSVAISYTTDVGGPAVPVAHILALIGGNNITTTGLGNTVTFDVTGTTNHAVQVGNATGSLTSLAVGATGEGLMGNTGADPSWTGSPTYSGTVTGGTGLVATTGDVTITAGNLDLPNTNAAGTEGIIGFGGAMWINNLGTHNTFVGEDSGNLALTVATTTDNTGLGYHALNILDGATSSVALGADALALLVSGDFNTACGSSALGQVATGEYNIGLGASAGSAITLASSSNICIGNVGAAESNTIRIGTQGNGAGQQDKTYIAGIYGATVAAATSSVVSVDANGLLGYTAPGTDGQLLISATGAAPIWANLSSTTGTITITNGVNSINLEVSAGGIVWSREAGAAVAAVADHGYVNTNAGLTTITLPATASLGTIIEILGEGAGGWTIAQNAGQNIQYGNVSTTVGAGGSLSSSNQYDTVRLICRLANTTWSVTASTGVLSVV